MKAERLWEALGEAGDSYIEEILVQTDKINGKSRKGRLWKTAAAAVLLAFCFLREFPFWRRRCRLFIRYCIRYHPLRHNFLFLSGNPVKITESGWRWKPPVSGVIRP